MGIFGNMVFNGKNVVITNTRNGRKTIPPRNQGIFRGIQLPHVWYYYMKEYKP
jgi:hypothetical protein